MAGAGTPRPVPGDGAASLGQVLCPGPAPAGTLPAPRLSFPICKMGRIILPYLTGSCQVELVSAHPEPPAAGTARDVGHCPPQGIRTGGIFLAPPLDSIESPDEQCPQGAGVQRGGRTRGSTHAQATCPLPSAVPRSLERHHPTAPSSRGHPGSPRACVVLPLLLSLLGEQLARGACGWDPGDPQTMHGDWPHCFGEVAPPPGDWHPLASCPVLWLGCPGPAPHPRGAQVGSVGGLGERSLRASSGLRSHPHVCVPRRQGDGHPLQPKLTLLVLHPGPAHPGPRSPLPPTHPPTHAARTPHTMPKPGEQLFHPPNLPSQHGAGGAAR